MFCDFGDEFEVLDTTGEEPKEIFISNITQVRGAYHHTVMRQFILCYWESEPELGVLWCQC